MAVPHDDRATRYTDYMLGTLAETDVAGYGPHAEEVRRIFALALQVVAAGESGTAVSDDDLDAHLDGLVSQALEVFGGDERLCIWYLLGVTGLHARRRVSEGGLGEVPPWGS